MPAGSQLNAGNRLVLILILKIIRIIWAQEVYQSNTG